MSAPALAERPTLSPAKKAWETRRRLATARADIVTRNTPVAVEASPLGDAQMVELYVDSPTIGCGFRRFVVVEIGPRWVTLFSAARLLNHRVDRATFDRKAKPVTFKARTVAGIIRENIEATKTRSIEPGEGARRVAAGKVALRVLKSGRA